MGKRYLIVASQFNDMISKALMDGATSTLRDAGLSESDVEQIWVPGCFELPVVAAQAARSNRYSGVICLGCVIRGETPHFDFVAGEAARGLMQVGIDTGVPIIFGVLTTDNEQQALARSGLKGGNKGRDAAQAALHMSRVMGQLQEGSLS